MDALLPRFLLSGPRLRPDNTFPLNPNWQKERGGGGWGVGRMEERGWGMERVGSERMRETGAQSFLFSCFLIVAMALSIFPCDPFCFVFLHATA